MPSSSSSSPAPLLAYARLSSAAIAQCRDAVVLLEREYVRAQAQAALQSTSPCLVRFPELRELCFEIDTRVLTERQRVIHEVFTSEKIYLDQLFMLHELYAQPLARAADGLQMVQDAAMVGKGLMGASGSGKGSGAGGTKASKDVRREQKKMLRTPELKVLLSSIEAIVGTNKKLMRDLLQALNEWTQPVLIGRVFARLGHFFQQYDSLVAANHKAVELLSSSAFKEFVLACQLAGEEQSGSSDGGVNSSSGAGGGTTATDFETLLIAPMQRVTRYCTLLEVRIPRAELAGWRRSGGARHGA